MSRVRATEAGYDNTVIRQPGDKFDWPDTIEVNGAEVKNPIPDWCEKLPDINPDKKNKTPASGGDGFGLA